MGGKLNKTSVFINAVIGVFAFIVLAYVNFTIYYLYKRNVQPEQTAINKHDDQNLLLAEIVGQLVQEHYVDRQSIGIHEMLSNLWLHLHSTRLVRANQAGVLFSLHDDDKRQLVVKSEDSFSKVVLEIAEWLYTNRKYADAFSWQDERDSVLYVLNVILAGLDSHSIVLRPSEYEELKQGTEGEFGGIGVSVSMKDDILTVLEPLPNSPAFFAGIKKDDQIISIDDYGVYELTLDDLVELIRGNPGTPIELSLLRADNMHPFRVDITRAVVQVESVVSEYLYAGQYPVLYLRLKTFSSRSAQEINAALLKFRLRHNKHYGVILDLRGNPGGLLDQAIEVADQFISSGTLVRTTGNNVATEQANFAPHENDYPMAVLIDKESASASEIVAGALQDHARAYVIGAPSFGKGSVQTVFELPFGQAIKLTVARYFTPSGRSIVGGGICPDIWLQPIASTFNKAVGSHEFKGSRSAAALKAYYLNHNDDDQVLQTAMVALRQTIPAHVRNKKFVASRNKLTKVSEHVASYDKVVADWLAAQHSLDWQADSSKAHEARLQIDQLPKTVVAGELLKLNYQAINASASGLQRASIYAQIRIDEMLTHEELIGHIAADAIHHGVLMFKIPTYASQQIYDVTIGLAIDGKVIDKQTHKLLVRARPKTTLDLQVYTSDDVIAAGEVETVTLQITNHGKHAAEDLKVKIQNLSGKQIQIPLTEHELSHLPAGKSISLKFPLHAARQLFTRTLSLGIQVMSDDLQKPARKQYTIMSKSAAVQVGL